MKISLLLAILLLSFLHAGAQTPPPYEYFIRGDAADAKPAKTRGGLFLAGGGGHVLAGWKWFIECAGGGDIVVLSASGTDSYQRYFTENLGGGVNSVETIKFNDGSAARDPRVLDLIAKADGLFLAGGKQTRYLAWWKNTPVADAINAHIRAGKPLGGGSAGLAVLGEYHYGSMNGSILTKTALADPFHRNIDLGSGFIRAPLLDGILTDSHFSQRDRLGRLFVFLARLTAEVKPAHLAGIGIDEGTALCIEPDGVGRVFTEKKGGAWLVQLEQPATTLEAGKPLVLEHVKVTGIGPESLLRLPSLEVTKPVSIRRMSAREGVVREEP